MKVTYNWLKDFIPIKLSPQSLAERLTMAGLEVVGLHEESGDYVFEIEITSNRPDWLSVIGIAREVAAITGVKLMTPKGKQRTATKNLKSSSPLSIAVHDVRDCPLYTAKLIREVTVAPSPEWMRKRLELVGCRSINNIVDITNYLLFELGEPLHAFDADSLEGEAVVVRRARGGEKIVSIDDKERVLSSDTLIIADKKKPIAIAGIMGGKFTEVGSGTRSVLLEAAVFNPTVVRRGRQALGLQSESAYRFERGVDSAMVRIASLRAATFIQQFAGGICCLDKEKGAKVLPARKILFPMGDIERVLGVSIPPTRIKSILEGLQFSVNRKAQGVFSVRVPSFREDVQASVDLVEEVARIYGYEKMRATLPRAVIAERIPGTRDFFSLVRTILAGLGLYEAITYTLVDKDWLDGKAMAHAIEILNPLSKEQGVLRPDIISSLLGCLEHNFNQKQDHVMLFEVSKVFAWEGDFPGEKWVLGLALCGTRSLLMERGAEQENIGMTQMKGIIETLCDRLGIKACQWEVSEDARKIAFGVNGTRAGTIWYFKKDTVEKFDIKNKDVFVAELSLDILVAAADLKKHFVPLPKYPAIARDISMVVKENTSVADILQAIQKKAGMLLKGLGVIDFYKGEQIPSGFKGLTISCSYRAEDRTLTETEIAPLHESVAVLLRETFGAQIR